jgi:hypothetical protein
MMVQSLQEQKQTKSTKGAGIIGIVFHTKDIDSAIEGNAILESSLRIERA